MTQQLTATGGTPPYTWSTVTALPAGITLSSGGLLSGTPSVAASGNFTVRLTDSVGATTTADVWIDAIALAPSIPPVVEQLDFTVSIIAEVEMGGSDLAIAPLVLAIVPEVDFKIVTPLLAVARHAHRGAVVPRSVANARHAHRGAVVPRSAANAWHQHQGSAVTVHVPPPVVARHAHRGAIVARSVANARHAHRGAVVPRSVVNVRHQHQGYATTVNVVPSPYLAETNAWRARVQAKGADVSTAGLDAIDTFIRALVTAGIDSKFKLFHFYAGINAFSALNTPYRHPANTDATLSSFVSGDYNPSGASCGLLGGSESSNKFVNHNYNVGDNHPGFDFAMGAFVRGAGTAADYGQIMGTQDNGSRSCGITWRSSGSTRLRMFDYDNAVFASPVSGADLLITGSLTSASDLRLYGGAALAGSNTSTRTLDSTGLGSLRSFTYPAEFGVTNRRLVLSFAGNGLTAGEVATLNTAATTLISSLSV